MKPEQDWETGRETAGCWAGLPLEDFLSADGQRTPRREALYGEAQASSPEDVPSSTQTEMFGGETLDTWCGGESDFLLCLWTADCLRRCCSVRLLLRFDFYSLLDARIVFQPLQSRPSLRRLLTLSPHPSLSVFSSLHRSILSFLLSVCLFFWAHPPLQRKSYFNNWIFILFS